MREVFLIIMLVLALVCFFRAGMCMDDNKQYGILIVAALFLICGISIILNYVLIYQNNKLEQQSKGLPKYEKIENVYILKK
jgi:uncharacterized membrane protein